MLPGGVLIAGNENRVSSYRYLAEYTGTAVLTAENLVFVDVEGTAGIANAAFAITVNGKAVWPAGADAGDASTWYYAGNKANQNVADELGEVIVTLTEGDAVEFLFAKINSGWATADFRPVVTYTNIVDTAGKYRVTYLDRTGSPYANYLCAAGDAFPLYPAAEGWDITGDGKADYLPETVTADCVLTEVYNDLLDSNNSTHSFSPTYVNGVFTGKKDNWDVVFTQAVSSKMQ